MISTTYLEIYAAQHVRSIIAYFHYRNYKTNRICIVGKHHRQIDRDSQRDNSTTLGLFTILKTKCVWYAYTWDRHMRMNELVCENARKWELLAHTGFTGSMLMTKSALSWHQFSSEDNFTTFTFSRYTIVIKTNQNINQQ